MGSWESTEYLEDFALRLGALLQFDRRYLNIKDPANEQAMYWVSRNLSLLPTDTRSFVAGNKGTGVGMGEGQSMEDENQRLWHEWLDLDPEQQGHV
jgi:hypothetical protein